MEATKATLSIVVYSSMVTGALGGGVHNSLTNSSYCVEKEDEVNAFLLLKYGRNKLRVWFKRSESTEQMVV